MFLKNHKAGQARTRTWVGCSQRFSWDPLGSPETFPPRHFLRVCRCWQLKQVAQGGGPESSDSLPDLTPRRGRRGFPGATTSDLGRKRRAGLGLGLPGVLGESAETTAPETPVASALAFRRPQVLLRVDLNKGVLRERPPKQKGMGSQRCHFVASLPF